MLYVDYNILAYGRFSVKEQCIMLVNNNDCEKKLEMKVWDIGVPREAVAVCLMYTYEDGYSIEPREYVISSGRLEITLKKTSAMVLRVQETVSTE